MVADKTRGHPDERFPLSFDIPNSRIRLMEDLGGEIQNTFENLEPGSEYAAGMICHVNTPFLTFHFSLTIPLCTYDLMIFIHCSPCEER